MPGNVFIVGLAGPSGSGKSTVAKSVASRLNGQVISMEIYSVETNRLPLEERAKLDYDAPSAIEVELLESHIRKYASGCAIEAPIYDFAQHMRVKDRREHIPAKSLRIVEGILALHFAELRPYFDLSIYLDAPDEVCFHRRKVRDITQRRRVPWISSAGNTRTTSCLRLDNIYFPARDTPASWSKVHRTCQSWRKTFYEIVVGKRALVAVQ